MREKSRHVQLHISTGWLEARRIPSVPLRADLLAVSMMVSLLSERRARVSPKPPTSEPDPLPIEMDRGWSRLGRGLRHAIGVSRCRPGEAWTRSDLFWALLVYVVALWLYVPTATRGISGEDAGELLGAAAAPIPGVPHPSGYPVWVLLARGAALGFEVGTIPQRVAWLSGLLAALAAVLAYLFTRCFVGGMTGRIAAAGLAVVLAASDTVWSQSTIPEVYTLNLFFLLAVLLCFRRFGETDGRGWFFGGVVLYGLSLGNHHTMGALGPAIALYVVLVRPAVVRRWRWHLASLALLALTLCTYLYFPWAASQDPYVNWGDPHNLERTIDHALRRQYTNAEPDPAIAMRSVSGFVTRVGVFGQELGEQFPLLVCALALFGWGVLWRRQRLDAWFLLGIAGACSLGIVWMTNFKLVFEHMYATSLFFIPTYAMLTIFAAIGLAWWLDRLRGRVSARVVAVLGGLTALVLVMTTVRANLPHNDRSTQYWVEDYVHAVLDGLEPNALVLPSGDHHTFPLIYLLCVECRRPDVVLADKYGYLDPPVMESMPAAFWEARAHVPKGKRKAFDERCVVHEAMAAGRPVYVSTSRNPDAFPGCQLVPSGLLFRVVPREDLATIEGTRAKAKRFWETIAIRNGGREATVPWDLTAHFILSDLDFFYARHLLDIGSLDEARLAFESLFRRAHVSRETWNNAGSALAEMGLPEDAVRYFQQALVLDPTYRLAKQNLAITYVASKQWEPAEGLLEALWEESPTDRRILLLLGDVYRYRGHSQAAVNTYSRLTVFDERDAEAYLRAATVYEEELADPEKAEALVGYVLSFDPTNAQARARQERLAQAHEQRHAALNAPMGTPRPPGPQIEIPTPNIPITVDPWSGVAGGQPPTTW